MKKKKFQKEAAAMFDLHDRSYCPALEEIGEYIDNPLFLEFCLDVKKRYCCVEQICFSSCSWEPGWNVKFKKSGKSLCTIYPRKGFFTVMVVVGRKEKELVEQILPECAPELGEIYWQTREGNGQRWLMVDLEDQEMVYEDLFRLMDVRRGKFLTYAGNDL